MGSLIKEDEQEFKKECPNYIYMPPILPKQDRIVVIGDLHGDYKLTLDCLKLCGVVDKNLNLIGGKTVVVQVGDQIDRCRPIKLKCDHEYATIKDEASDTKILEFFTKLNEQAKKFGGAVYSLLGNHELMNVRGNLDYVSYRGLTEFADYKSGDIDFKKKYPNLSAVERGKIARSYAFKPGQKYAKFLACTRLPCLIVGSFLFAHAGFIPQFTDQLNIKDRDDLVRLDITIRRWLLGLINKDYVDQIVGSNDYSMFWNRILGSIPPNMNNKDEKCIKYLDPVLKLFKVGAMVVGHTPQYFINKHGVNGTCGSRLWRVDHGGSDAFANFDIEFLAKGGKSTPRKPQVLLIENDSIIKVLRYES
jgi:hypothetical protein